MPILLEDALRMLLDNVEKSETVRMPLSECYGHVLAEDITAATDFPPFRRSPLDGYAVRYADIYSASEYHPVLLRQIDNVPAGSTPSKRVESNEAVRIMTGAPLPEEADAVVRIEDTAIWDGQVIVFTAEQAARNICNQGEEFRAGEIVLHQGCEISEGELGLLAMMGCAQPLVYQKPKIGILATGSELQPVSEALRNGKIYDSNSYMLLGKVLRAGALPVLLGSVRDDLDEIAAKLDEVPGLSMYLTTGGASVGDYDLMPALFSRLGVDPFFTRIAIKPGMPVMAGRWNKAMLAALSGNPAAASVSFEVLIRPAIRKLCGATAIHRPKIKVKVAGGFRKPSIARRFVWARCYDHGGLRAEVLGYQGNGMLRSAQSANVLLDIPPGSPPVNDGDELDAILLL